MKREGKKSVTRGLQTTFRSPVLIYQRHRNRIEDLLLSGVLAFLVALFLHAAGSYPDQWRTVLLLAVVALGARSRAFAYYAAIVPLLWPLWQLSPYLMTLFLVVTLLPRTWMIRNLPWVLLVVSAPLLAQWQALALVPLLAALLLGPGGGWWAGAAAALWLKVVGGLTGWIPELGAMHGAPFPYALLQQQVGEANSLETLLLLAAPFTQSSSLLLLHVLQVALWGLAGWLAGHVHRMTWQNGEPRFVLAPILATGALTLWVAIFIIPAWLAFQPYTAFLSQPTPTVGIALSAMTAAIVATVYEGAKRPLPRPSQRRTTMLMGREGPKTVEVDRPRRRSRPQQSSGEADDVIMLELD